jgi:hypothetical protein
MFEEALSRHIDVKEDEADPQDNFFSGDDEVNPLHGSPYKIPSLPRQPRRKRTLPRR